MKHIKHSALVIVFFSLLSVLCQAEEISENLNSPAIMEKLMLRGKSEGLKVSEIRAEQKNDVLIVQADLRNTLKKDRVIFYRYRWQDDNGNQVGDEEVWKQIKVLGLQSKTVRGVALNAKATDFRIEMNVEPY